jgi:hypothetical protein
MWAYSLVFVDQCAGTHATYSFQRILLQLSRGQSNPLFNFLQVFLLLLMVRYAWTKNRIDRMEDWIHGLVWLYSLILSITPLPLFLYKNNILVCFFGLYPQKCKDSFMYSMQRTVFEETMHGFGPLCLSFSFLLRAVHTWSCHLQDSHVTFGAKNGEPHFQICGSQFSITPACNSRRYGSMQ